VGLRVTSGLEEQLHVGSRERACRSSLQQSIRNAVADVPSVEPLLGRSYEATPTRARGSATPVSLLLVKSTSHTRRTESPLCRFAVIQTLCPHTCNCFLAIHTHTRQHPTSHSASLALTSIRATTARLPALPCSHRSVPATVPPYYPTQSCLKTPSTASAPSSTNFPPGSPA
jgi:hypothetical protein